jgi:hypothetical protein
MSHYQFQASRSFYFLRSRRANSPDFKIELKHNLKFNVDMMPKGKMKKVLFNLLFRSNRTFYRSSSTHKVRQYCLIKTAVNRTGIKN